jgi:hypothetical protein
MGWPVNWMHMQRTIFTLNCRHLPVLALSRTYTSTCHRSAPVIAKSFVVHILCSFEVVYSPRGTQAYVLYVVAEVERASSAAWFQSHAYPESKSRAITSGDLACNLVLLTLPDRDSMRLSLKDEMSLVSGALLLLPMVTKVSSRVRR